MEKEVYIHYGHNKFDIGKWNTPKNRGGFNKPNGGLWASSTKSKFGWKDWCEQEDFRECEEENSFTFRISDNANIYHIYCKEDVEKLPMTNFSCEHMLMPDFEKILEMGYDAIEFHLSEEHEVEDYFNGIYYVLYGWDCDSILILNKDVIHCQED